MERVPSIEGLLRRERAVTVAALAAVLAASWAYLLVGAGTRMPTAEMSSLDLALGRVDSGHPGAMAAMGMPTRWTASYALMMAVMWWIMMIAMMLPSAAPTILLYGAIVRRRSNHPRLSRASAAFAGGYLLAWAGFSVVAVALQWAFERQGVLSPMTLNSTNAAFAGGLLIFAGLYQLTPLKQACLRHCRGPVAFLTRNWRSGAGGAVGMGLQHGLFCVGCCWGLMAILFFGGIMNLYWIVGLAGIVLLEKLVPLGRPLSLVTGGVLVLWGAAYLGAAAGGP